MSRPGAIVVLGAKVLPGGVPSDALRARLERGVELFHQGVAPVLVLSGGGEALPHSEARVMFELATALGVPSSACVLEEDSRSTYDNARFSAVLLLARGIRHAVVVSDEFHLYRARAHFRLAGLEVDVAAARLEGRRLTLVERTRWRVREWVALVRRPQLLWAGRPRRST